MNIKDSNADRDLEALRAAIAGQVFVLGQAGYDQARQAWNLAVDERPSVVVVAESAADVVKAVRYARAHGMRIAPARHRPRRRAARTARRRDAAQYDAHAAGRH